MAVALFNHTFPHAGVLPVLALALACGILLGAVNGLLVWLLQVPPIVATLGTLSIYRGLVFVLSQGAWINSNDMSPQFLGFVRAQLFGLTSLSWIAILAALAGFIFLRFTRAGRDLYTAGDNPDAAVYAGVNIGRTLCTAFILSGALAGLCGYFWVARFAVAYTDVALGFELQVIAACVIGGVSIAGGVGTVTGVVLGCLFLGIIKNALPLIGLSPFWQMAVSGLVITGAVVVNARTQKPAERVILQEAVS
jgi:rhamnose transport system permease protein